MAQQCCPAFRQRGEAPGLSGIKPGRGPGWPRCPYTAFTWKKGKAVTARLIVRRVKGLNPAGQDGSQ
jgi:hypothetical protein